MPHDDDSLMINSQMRAIYEKAIASLEDGSQFAEYTIVRLLGRGGMGAVYEARHVTLERSYAIKVLPYEFMARRDALERFENEARVMANLEHPNIVRVDDFRQTQGLYWLRMELARGDGGGAVSLQDLAERTGGVVDQELLLDLMTDVLKGVGYAHEKGVIHRDLKPANILLFPKPGGGLTAKVADYGLVKLLGDEFLRSRVTHSVKMSMGGRVPDDKQGTSTRALLGTWEYMAPEQQQGGAVSPRSDVYSLGSMTYRLLTGEKLSMQSPSDIREELVDEWDDVCRKALFTKPERRYADAAAMLEAMRPIRVVIERREAEDAGQLEPALELLKKIDQAYPGRPDIAGDIHRVRKSIEVIRKDSELQAAEEYDRRECSAPEKRACVEKAKRENDRQKSLEEESDTGKKNRFDEEILRDGHCGTSLRGEPDQEEVRTQMDLRNNNVKCNIPEDKKSLRLCKAGFVSEMKKLDDLEKKSEWDSGRKRVIISWMVALGIVISSLTWVMIRSSNTQMDLNAIPVLSKTPFPKPQKQDSKTRNSEFVNNEPYLADRPGVTPPVVQNAIPLKLPSYLVGRYQTPLTVVVQCIILKTGKLSRAEILKSIDPDVDNLAIEAVNSWTFNNGTYHNRPVDILMDIPVTFE